MSLYSGVKLKERITISDIGVFKTCLFYSFFLGLFAYGYMMSNDFYSHDSLVSIFTRSDDTWQITIGRFLQPLIREILFGTITTYWYQCALGLFFCSISAFILYYLFEIRNKTFLFFIVSVLTLNLSSVLLVSTYIQNFCTYSLAQLLAIVSVFLLFRDKKNWFLAFIFLFFSLAIYQLYISTFLVLIVIKIVQLLANRTQISFLSLAKRTVITVLVALGAYYLGLKLSCNLYGVKLASSYNSVDNALTLSNKSLDLFIKVYVSFFDFFFGKTLYWNVLLIAFNGALLLLVLIFILKSVKKSHSVFVSLLLLSLPIVSNLVVFLNGGVSHELMLTPLFNCLFIFCLLPISKTRLDCNIKQNLTHPFFSRLCYVILILFSIIFSFNSIKFSNELAEKKHLEFVQTASNVSEFLCELNTVPGYIAGKTPVEIVVPGHKYYGSIFNSRNHELADLYDFTGNWHPSPITDPRYAIPYLKKYLNKRINLVGITQLELWPHKEEIENKKFIYRNGVLYVKITD
ncbi:glucosyltransferase domain-containing protein [Parasutterella excrementihominis]|uniref:glucosyltransferase domain-containing protein n=1 Tax=Parasutterella excrementihominis TaxID=487175 RepID=UPI0025B0E17A|nr:glucosyltransferase domain-containing protein [Parasutterella excrementihominis]